MCKEIARAYAEHLLSKMGTSWSKDWEHREELDLVSIPADCELSHLQWMCEQVIGAEDWSVTKMHRWIGYVQGVLVARQFSTVQQERDDYRRIKQEVLKDKT